MSGQAQFVQCGTHGKVRSAVVCGHMISAKEKIVGFVENSSDPDDLQAWCEMCEAMFLREGSLTEAFRRFTDMTIVCEFCYASLRARHLRESSGAA